MHKNADGHLKFGKPIGTVHTEAIVSQVFSYIMLLVLFHVIQKGFLYSIRTVNNKYAVKWYLGKQFLRQFCHYYFLNIDILLSMQLVIVIFPTAFGHRHLHIQRTMSLIMNHY